MASKKTNKNFEIKKVYLFGVKNPTITFEGTKNVDYIEPKIYEDNKEIEYSINPVSSKDEFSIVCTLNKNKSIVKVFDKKNNNVYTYKNYPLKRIITKIKRKISRFFIIFRAFFITLGKGIVFFWKKYHFLVPPKLWKKYLTDFKTRVRYRDTNSFNNPYNMEEYNKWINKYEKEDGELINFKYKPLISILIPVYNIGKRYLDDCVNSILDQTYENFEICLVDDASTNEETISALKELESKDKRIKVKYRKENGHISKATNDALKMAKGEFISLVDDDDLLTKNALYEVVKALNNNKKLDFIYSDEDKLNKHGRRCDPNFKPDFSPDTLLSLNYICHLTTIRKTLVEKVGGFEVGLEGAQDYDLFLKCTEKTKNIYHIPKILYHWRMVEGSTSMEIDNKSYAVLKGKKAIENALKRRKIEANVLVDEKSTYYIVDYIIKKEPLVSIIIPTKDYADTTRTCLESLYKKTTYKNFEVLLVNNNSEKEETFKLFEEYKNKYKNFKVIDANYEFNYAKINNEAARESKGEYLCLLNNDTEVISPDWLTKLVSYAMQEHVGCVGPKLYYPDTTIQHGGVIIGLGGVASHAYIGSPRVDKGDYGRLCVPYDYAGVTAACLVVKKDKFFEVNGLEEDLKVAYNDIDFDLKLLEKGYYNVFIPMVELYHYESKSRGYDTTSEKYKRFKIEADYMYKKWDKYIKADPYYNQNYSKNAWFKLDK